MDMFKDKSWVKLRRLDNKYVESLNVFLDYACATSSVDDKIACPCSICGNRKYYDKETVKGHLLMKAMDVDYQKCVWVFHGESCNNDYEGDSDCDMMDDGELKDDNDNGEPIGHDMYGMVGKSFENCHGDSSPSGQNEEAMTFFKLHEDVGQPLYHGCEKFSKSSFINEMYNLKCLCGLKRPEHIPLTMWTNLIEFWSSDSGKKISEIVTKNRSKNQVAAYYSRTRSHARIRAYEEKVEIGAPARDELFEKTMREDKNGYAKTFGMRARILRSRSKRCALKEDKTKILKIEQVHEEIEEIKERLQTLEDVVLLLLKNQVSTSNQSKIRDVTMDSNATTEKNQDEDRCNENEVESKEAEDDEDEH